MFIAALLATLSYLYATWLLHQATTKRVPILLAMILAFCVHATEIVYDFNGWMHNVSVTNILTLVSLCMTLLGALRYIWCADRIAYPVVAMMAAVCVWSPILAPAPTTIAQGWALKVHIVLSVAAYIALGFAALYACFLLVQDYRLRHGKDGFDLSVPLHDLEYTMMSFTRFGEILLTLSLATGIIFIHDIWEQHVGHKLFFGVASWLIFVIILILNHLRGFRGRAAALWVLGGFVLLALAYFGSAFILQFLLNS